MDGRSLFRRRFEQIQNLTSRVEVVGQLFVLLEDCEEAGDLEFEAEVTLFMQSFLVGEEVPVTQQNILASQMHLSRMINLLFDGVDLPPAIAAELLHAAAFVESHISGRDPVQGLKRASEALTEGIERLSAWVDGGNERDHLISHLLSSRGLMSQRLHELGCETANEAVVDFDQALEFRTRDEYPVDWAFTTMNLAVAIEKVGGAERIHEAYEMTVQCTAVFREVDHLLGVGNSLVNEAQFLVTMYDNVGPDESRNGRVCAELIGAARSAISGAIELLDAEDLGPEAGHLYAIRAKVDSRAGSDICTDASRAIEMIPAGEGKEDVTHVASMAGDACAECHDWESAATFYQYAADADRALGHSHVRSTDRTSSLADGDTYNRWAAQAWAFLGDGTRAVSTLERSACRELKHMMLRGSVNEYVSSVHAVQPAATDALDLADRERRSSIRNRLRGEDEPEVTVDATSWYFLTRKVHALLGVSPPFEEPRILSAVVTGSSEVVVVVNASPFGISFVVFVDGRPDPIVLSSMETTSTLLAQRMLIGSPEQDAYLKFLGGDGDANAHMLALGRLLDNELAALDQIVDEAGAKVLSVMAVGPYSILPWQTMCFGPKGRRLIDRVAIRQTPSLEVLAECRSRGSRRCFASILLLADPEPHTSPLPGTLREADQIRRLTSELSQTILLGSDATGEGLATAFASHDIVHLACHGASTALHPEVDSGLSLAFDENFSWGQVTALISERSPLVVLSACQTALPGSYSEISEQFGLPYAFLVAGASGVIASQWPVDDDATAVLMAKFYELLMSDGPTPHECLREAQLWMRSAPLGLIARLVRGSSEVLFAARVRAGDTAGSVPYADEALWGAFIYIGA